MASPLYSLLAALGIGAPSWVRNLRLRGRLGSVVSQSKRMTILVPRDILETAAWNKERQLAQSFVRANIRMLQPPFAARGLQILDDFMAIPYASSKREWNHFFEESDMLFSRVLLTNKADELSRANPAETETIKLNLRELCENPLFETVYRGSIDEMIQRLQTPR